MMLTSINNLFRSSRTLKALIGVTRDEFIELLAIFEEVLKDKELAKGADPTRKRAPGGGRKSTLRNSMGKLFFILFYVKCYPTFDVVGMIFGVHRSQACRWVAVLLPLLQEALRRKNVLPYRRLDSEEEFIEAFPERNDIFIDGTERPVQRPKDEEAQKACYSGKKKRHTKKNLVVNDEHKRILILTPTCNGKRHDYALFKESELGNHIPRTCSTWVDSGFEGIKKDYSNLDVIIPVKKPKGGQLSPLKKQLNTMVARGRVLSENAIAGIKRLRSVTDIYRNKRPKMEDRLMLVASGIWNNHLEMSAESRG